MFSTLRTRFGIPGIISVIALVFAMFGGAYAASNSSGGGKATASKTKKAKAKKGPRGPKGATGPAGAAGPVGPAGPQGAAGANGKDGASGSAGSAGASGQSVTTTPEPPFGNCGDQEGVKLTSASGVSYVCNGEDGAEGSPGPTETTLPSGKTETGTFTFGGEDQPFAMTAISYPLRLSFTPTVKWVYNPLDTPVTGCPGTAANPKAAAGTVCVYPEVISGAGTGDQHEPNTIVLTDPTSGAALEFLTTAGEFYSWGTWAATAP